MQIYVGNLPIEFTDEKLRSMFEAYGRVAAATIGIDKKTGVSQGYGFVDMPVKSEARAAIEALRGKEVEGKPLRVKALKPDDEFLKHAVALHRAPGTKAGPQHRGDVSHRASGAIRRGGQRGT